SRGPGATRLDLFYTAMKAYPDVKVLDLRPLLLEAKQRERVYFKTDSHWNYLGAEVGYNALVATLKSVVPSVPGVPLRRPPYDPKVVFVSGDLSKRLGLPERIQEDDIAPFGKVWADVSSRCAQPDQSPLPADYPPISADVQVYVCDR